MRQLMLHSKTTRNGIKPQTMLVGILSFINLLPVSSASLRTVPHFIPDLRPLLTPSKAAPANSAGLCRKIDFLHLLDTHAQ